MIDAYLYAVRDGLRSDLGYNAAGCELTDTDGMPPPRMGTKFVAVHQLATRTGPETDNKLDELYGFGITLTQRVTVPLDRVGDQQLAIKLARETGFNRLCDQLRSYCHMAWGLLQDANNNMLAWEPQTTGIVYGFAEPARYRGMELPKIVGGAWFRANPESENFGLVSTLRFEDARRFQPIAEYV